MEFGKKSNSSTSTYTNNTPDDSADISQVKPCTLHVTQATSNIQVLDFKMCFLGQYPFLILTELILLKRK